MAKGKGKPAVDVEDSPVDVVWDPQASVSAQIVGTRWNIKEEFRATKSIVPSAVPRWSDLKRKDVEQITPFLILSFLLT